MSRNKTEAVQTQYAYTAKTEYNADCISAFCRARFAIYQKKKQLIVVLISLVLIIVGAVGLLGKVGAVISIPAGCWLLTALGSFPKSDADRMIAAADGRYPVSDYGFDGRGFDIISGRQTNRLEYASMIKLVEDEHYFFFFATPKLAYMVNKSCISPKNEDSFRSYTAKHCGLEWSTLRPWYEFSSVLWRRNKR